MNKKPLTPRKIINVKGKMLYNESKQAWCNIKLKRELINEFPQLREKRSNFSYEMMFCRTADELKEILKKMEGDEEAMPIMMFLWRDG